MRLLTAVQVKCTALIQVHLKLVLKPARGIVALLIGPARFKAGRPASFKMGQVGNRAVTYPQTRPSPHQGTRSFAFALLCTKCSHTIHTRTMSNHMFKGGGGALSIGQQVGVLIWKHAPHVEYRSLMKYLLNRKFNCIHRCCGNKNLRHHGSLYRTAI